MEFSNILTLIGMAVMVIAAFYATKNDVQLVRNDLNNHKESHKKLEERVTQHEDKLDDKLDELNRKIEDKHNILNTKLDGLKDLIIERISK